jgi:PPE-repeat protein
MNFCVLPPEVTSAQLYTGAGSGPMLAAAASWDGLGSELGAAAESFSSVTSGLVGGAWQGAASRAMAGVAGQYGQWLSTAAAHAGGAAAQAKAIAGIFEAAKTAITHPLAVAANRVQLVNLVRSNLLGFNAPAIAATEGAYESMWAQNVATLAGYHGAASAVAAQLTPWQQALQPLGGSAAPAASPAASITLTQLFQDIAASNQVFVAQLRSQTQTGIFVVKSFLSSGFNAAGAALGSGNIGMAAGEVFGTAAVGVGSLTEVFGEDVGTLIELPGGDLALLGEGLEAGIHGF